MIPGYQLNVAQVIVKTLRKSIEGRILEEYLFHELCSRK